ncbi:Glycoside hydrolase family 17 [Dillenia turbinata]|uniref:Glycoside hydrolase family 17 n=1 Tax=Dillenia turbinata TaxID=194707 RepID=A0AAN8VAH2_9MAGN
MSYLPNMTDPNKAHAWIEQHVQPYISLTKITCITVGNEVFSSNDTQSMNSLLPAMQTIYGSLVSLGLDEQVTVNIQGLSNQILLSISNPFLISMPKSNRLFLLMPIHNPDYVSLEYVLFQPNQGMTDSNTNLNYDNILYAQIDAVY